jgi:Holliday junction resolvasome RuvABC DNA-binding subunit
MILDLSGKLTLEEPVKAETVKLREDLISGLVNLGYPTKGSSECISQILRDNPDLKNFEKLFKIALKKISRR